MDYFTISELIYSEKYWNKIWNKTTPEVERSLTALVDAVLDPLRKMWGKPITVNSGYRCEEINRKVGGVATSQHLRGEAADITVGSAAKNKELARLLVKSGLPFDQLINEYNWAWVHVSYRRVGVNRRQLLKTAKNGGYIMLKESEI